MEYKTYEKDGRVISATETAYEVIYRAQGFRLVEENPSVTADEEKKPSKGGKKDGKAGSDPGDHGEGTPTGEAQDA